MTDYLTATPVMKIFRINRPTLGRKTATLPHLGNKISAVCGSAFHRHAKTAIADFSLIF